ncbi:MAGUK p55 subfamily member 2 isoform X1 [Rhinolophus ferrumequinum]|nr:MAGUK p55 subfamily member 2 isoform X1 [Rhinolophus ferrumequinum]XP_032946759.1 MAGUK p55 subfamily member 2 isoform X1 [Rhinolophus ferrumequinum]XP_032946761.1 MAGUK p55 subfamily member 2 isoform X1 [Rhinolophus ferrumequinum]XP_032946762.1 MAGUK p55 subfamily member 2 isoform X1 [Rhinolophus ferrumequinum]XP_032946772.1 MAGUK p55 subfamily member 2 isoform X1 [Rhinolophus ferrumequinum]
MPVAATNSETAMQQVLDNLGSLPNATGAAELDLIFLRGIMESPIVRSLAKAHERLEETKLEAVRDNNLELVQEILRDLAQLAEQSSTAAELSRILQEPHFQVLTPFALGWRLGQAAGGGAGKKLEVGWEGPRAHCPQSLSFPPPLQSLLETHDSVASKTYETPPPSPGLDPTFSNQPVPPDAVRMVGIRKTAGEHLGVTFRVEGGELVIARILHGGMVAQQGLLHVGDIIKEVNGQPVGSDPRALQELLRSASGSVILKILPSYQEPHLPRQVFVKCHFDYDPARDSLIPCKEAGLRFTAGDLLQIVNQDDANWWQAELCPHPFQACHVEGGSAGLIPSQLLEEKRKAFVKRDLELTPTSGTLCGSLSGKKKKRMMYLTTKNAEFDRHELLIYEEVARMPPFRRKTLVLIGAQGVGRRSLKNKLIMWDPDRYGTTVPYTSRRPKDSEREGQGYSFVSRAEMEADIRAGRYLEHGEYEGNLYGTRIDSIRGVVAAGKVCVLDVNPQAVKVLRTAEFVPYVVFIEAPDFETLRAMNRAALESGVSTKQLTEADLRRTVEESSRIQRGYGHYFDLNLVNSNLERTFRELQTAMEKLRTEPQWVPVSWVY